MAARRKPQTQPASRRPAATAGGSSPLYLQVCQSLHAEIEAGAYPVGSRFPTEADLQDRFAASRHTIREALRRLAALGLIERRQGAGTRVVSARPRSLYTHSVGSLAELFQFARETRMDVAESGFVALSAHEADDVEAQKGSSWLRVEGVRRAVPGDEPICAASIYVHPRFAQLLDDIGRLDGPVYAVLESRSGEEVAAVLQQISAGPMPERAWRSLGLRRRAQSLKIVRRYLDKDGGVMLVSVNWHPADTFSYMIRLKRGEAASQYPDDTRK